MMKIRITIVLTFWTLVICGQNRNSIWCFGDSAGIDFRNLSMPVPISSGLDTRGTCASISDSLGNLMFYVENRTVSNLRKTGLAFNRNHGIMLNGDSLHGDGVYSEMLIIPWPGKANLYYVFTLNIFNYPGLYYSVVDMDKDGGFGEVVSKNILLSSDSLCTGITAVKHGNGRDWWVIAKGYSANPDSTFYRYLVTQDTINGTEIEIGGNSNTNGGTLCFSKDGNYLAFASLAGLIETFDFDRCTGEVSNAKVIRAQTFSNPPHYFGAAFSASGDILYVSTSDIISRLYQLDLLSANPWASKETLAVLTSPEYTGGELRRGPDDKVYWTNTYTTPGIWPYPYPDSIYNSVNMNLSVVENPDVFGPGCNYNPYSFYLGGKRTYWGLPNNPDYELGPIWGSACDSLTNNIKSAFNDSEGPVVYPNPFKGHVRFTSKVSGEILIYDPVGNLVFQRQTMGQPEQMDLSFLRNGIYQLKFVGKDAVSAFQIVKL